MFNFLKNKKSEIINGVEIIRSKKRIKTISLRIKGGKVIINCPQFTSDSFLMNIIKKKSSWIEKKKKEVEKIKKISVANGNYFLFLGKKYKIIISDSEFSDVKLEQNKIKIFCLNNKAKKVLTMWLKVQANKYLTSRLNFVSRKIKINFKSVFIKQYKSRWGSCNSKAEILLNWKLIMLPKHIIDYVLIHELSHILEPNHSKNFWSLVKSFDKKYDIKKAWLKNYGSEIINFNS